jgi:predicted  nucleic acid-binding Zn-ribbon protein
VNPDLRNLIALQETEQKITELQKEISDIPQKIQSYQDEIHRIKEAHQRQVTKNQELSMLRRTREGDVDAMSSKLAKLKDQLMTVKTNKEYTAMLHEIQMAQERIRKTEDEILEIMEEMENLEEGLNTSEKEGGAKTGALEESIRRAEESIPRLEAEKSSLEEDKSSLEKSLGDEMLTHYRRIARIGKGIALAEAKDELCTMCHVRIRPQVYAELLKTDSICMCDSCSRILFLRTIT